MNLFIEISGWIGMICILLAYFLVSKEKVSSQSKLYQWINLIGATGLLINAVGYNIWPFVGLNFFWAAIALKTLFKIYRNQK